MKYSKIILFFGLSLPACVILRYLQISYTIDATTGFFLNEFKNYGQWMMVSTFILVLLTAVFSFFAHRAPQNPPKRNLGLRIASFIFALSVIFETFFESFSVNVRVWQIILLKLFGIAFAAFLVLYAAGLFINIKLSPMVAVLPVIYYVMKIVCDFTSISSLALISDNVMIIAAYCVILLFMLNFAKLYNGVDGERGFRKLLASGLSSIILCFTQSVPHFLVNMVNGLKYSHTSLAANVSIFCAGLFITVFLFSHFAKKNAEH